MNIWDATVDNGKYICKVVGAESNHHLGTLIVTVAESELELLRKDVSLAYGAIFGPDFADVAEWEEMSILAIDGYEAATRGEQS